MTPMNPYMQIKWQLERSSQFLGNKVKAALKHHIVKACHIQNTLWPPTPAQDKEQSTCPLATYAMSKLRTKHTKLM